MCCLLEGDTQLDTYMHQVSPLSGVIHVRFNQTILFQKVTLIREFKKKRTCARFKKIKKQYSNVKSHEPRETTHQRNGVLLNDVNQKRQWCFWSKDPETPQRNMSLAQNACLQYSFLLTLFNGIHPLQSWHPYIIKSTQSPTTN